MFIQIVNLTKKYDTGLVVLDNINLNIDKGEFVFLTGLSGAGKSTLIKLLFCEEMPSSGQVIIGSRSISRATTASRARASPSTGRTSPPPTDRRAGAMA
jgi:cell division transport system ATP-binding protein